MNPQKPIRILVADDHAVLRAGLVATIERRPDMSVVGEASTGKELVELFRLHRPDIAVVDLRMPEMEGIEALKVIRQDFPNARFIVLTIHAGEEDVYRAVQLGVKAYLLKDVPLEALLDTIRAVHAGETRIPAQIVAKLASRIGAPDLTAREREVLEEMARGRANQEIARKLLISESTVKTHINNILKKLDAEDRVQAVTTALRRGIVRTD